MGGGDRGEEPYTIEDFFVLIEKKPGNNVYQCRGNCGGMDQQGRSCGLKGTWPRERLFAHICRIPFKKVSLCTSLPTSLRGQEMDLQTIRSIATGLYNDYCAERKRATARKRAAELALEPEAKKSLLFAGAAGELDGAAAQSKLIVGADGTLGIKAYTSTEVNDMYAKAFVMSGVPYAFYGSKYFRKAVDMQMKCPDFKYVNTDTLANTHVANVYEDTVKRATTPLAADIKRYGTCGMSDGAKGTGGTPFVNYLVGSASGVYYVEAVDTTGVTKDMDYLAREHKRIAEKLGTMEYYDGLSDDPKKLNCPDHQDLVLVDGACASIESFLEKHMEGTTMGLCVPHSGDRYIDDIFHKGKRTLYVAGNKIQYDCCGDWACRLKEHSDAIIEFIWSRDKTRAFFLEASKEHSPSSRTKGKPINEREPRKQSKSAATRMVSEYYRMHDEAVTLRATYVALVSSSKFQEWLARQDSSTREEGARITTMVMDVAINNEKRAFLKVLFPILMLVRLGDGDAPQMHMVYEKCLYMFQNIQAAVKEAKDVEDGGPFDYGRLTNLEHICTNRHQYLHCTYHSVGFLLYPVRMLTLDIDELDKEFPGVKSELLDDLEAVAGKLFRNEVDTDDMVAEVSDEIMKYLKPGAHRGPVSVKFIKKIQEGKKPPWAWWESIGCRHFPHLARIALRVLTKQVGIGAVERSHKVMKKVSIKHEQLHR